MINSFTIRKLLMAAGLSRKLTRLEICRSSGCVTSYITKCLREEEFRNLVQKFRNLPADKDTKEYKGTATLMMEIGRLLYLEGENSLD